MVDEPGLRSAAFIGNVLTTMGQEKGKAYLQKLKAQKIANSTASGRQVLDLTIAGDSDRAADLT